LVGAQDCELRCVEAALRAIAAYRGKQPLFYRQAPGVLKRRRQVAIIESSESSNRLEGVTVAPGRLRCESGSPGR
jgi:hypothetical protein